MCMLIWPLPLRFSAMTFIKEKLDTYRLLFNFPAVTEETKKLVPRAFSSVKARPSPPASSQFPMERSFFYMSTSELYPLLISTIFTSPMASLRSKHFQWSYCGDLCFQSRMNRLGKMLEDRTSLNGPVRGTQYHLV